MAAARNFALIAASERASAVLSPPAVIYGADLGTFAKKKISVA